MEWITYCYVTVSLRCFVLPEMPFKQLLHLISTTPHAKSAVPRNLLPIYSKQMRRSTAVSTLWLTSS